MEQPITLETALRHLAELRRDTAAAAEAVQAAQQAVDATPQGQALNRERSRYSELGAQIAEADKLARRLVLEAYRATGEKKPAQGSEVKLYRQLRYDLGEVLTWCKAHAPTFVRESIDTATFNKVAHELPGAPVTVEWEPRVNITQNLSAYLVEEERSLPVCDVCDLDRTSCNLSPEACAKAEDLPF